MTFEIFEPTEDMQLVEYKPFDKKAYQKEYHKQWYLKNKEKKAESVRKWQAANPEKVAKANLKFRTEKYERCKFFSDRWRKSDSPKAKQFYIGKLLRDRLLLAVKNKQRSGSAVRDLGCSIEDFMKYIESKFQPGMSWDNQGEWHFDHIVPMSKFDLTNREELLKAVYYTNIQPLWGVDNLRKSNKL